MSIKEIISSTIETLLNWPKLKLIEALEKLKEKYNALEKQNRKFREENKKLAEENKKLRKMLEAHKIQSINKETNKPSSKKAEWEVKGVGNDGKKKMAEVRIPEKAQGTVKRLINRIVQKAPQ